MLLVDYALLIMAVVSTSTWVVWIVRHRKVSLYAIPPLTWSINVITYYMTAPMHTAVIHSIWSSVIALHAALLLMGISIEMVLEDIVVAK